MATSVHKSVFLSYASQDMDAARRIGEALRSEGIEVWLDADGGLEHGDEWDAKIRKQIKECLLFIPIISVNTQMRHEGYFRVEWELAAQRAIGIASGITFILPVVIDDTREFDAMVPDRFRAVQWTKLQGGVVTPEVKARFLKLWSQRTSTAKPIGEGEKPKVRLTPLDTLSKSSIPDKSIVVPPFDNLSPDPNDAYLADGLTEELISDLARIQALKVISRNSAAAIKQRTRDASEIARLLGVRYVLEGSVRRAGTSLRITAQLIDGTTDAQVWSEKYQGSVDDVFALQERLSAAIVDALRIKLSPQQALAAGARPTRDLRAYDIFLRARHEMWQFNPDAFQRARDLVRHGLSIFPDNAELLATGAYVEWLAYGGGMDTAPETLQRFGEFADRAVALDPNSALGWFARARFAVNMGQSRKAIEFCLRSAAIEPTGEALALLALMEGYVGDDEEAATHAESAVSLDPLGPFVLLWSAAALYTIGRPDAALSIAQRFDPGDWIGHFILGLIHAYLGNREYAIQFFRRLESHHAAPAEFGRIWLSALEGKPWKELASSTRAAWLTEIGMALYAGEGYAAGGQREEALFWTRVAVLNGVQNDRFLSQKSPHFAKLRDDPEFKTLIVLAQGQRAVWHNAARGKQPQIIEMPD